MYLLPATGDASITVSVTYDNDTKSYSYTSSSQLEANHKISIVGSYKAGTLDMSGTIKGATWDEERTIEFDFKENSTETTDNTVSVEAPEVGTFYSETCFVVSSTTNADGSVTVLLMSGNEKSKLFTEDPTDSTAIKTTINDAIAELAVEGIDGWRLPTVDELSAANDLLTTFNSSRPESTTSNFNSNAAPYFIIGSDGTIKEANGRNKFKEVSIGTSTRLRAFANITFK